MKKLLIFMLLIIVLTLIGCTDASVVSSNLSAAADQFEIFRRVVFYNGITGEYMLQIEGYSSIQADTLDGQLELTVKTDSGTYLKHFLGLSDNVTYFVEQLQPAQASTARYRVIFKPSVIVPNIDLE